MNEINGVCQIKSRETHNEGESHKFLTVFVVFMRVNITGNSQSRFFEKSCIWTVRKSGQLGGNLMGKVSGGRVLGTN